MKKQSVILILILIAGGSSAYAVGSGCITTDNLTVTGTCTECGAGGVEGNYTNYNTLYINKTYIPSAGGLFPQAVYISNQPETLVNTNDDVFMMDAAGTISDEGAVYSQSQTQVPTVQTTLTGQYKAMIISDGGGTIIVFKDANVISTIHPDLSNFDGSSLANSALAISPNGQYIALIGKDVSGTALRLVIFEGN